MYYARLELYLDPMLFPAQYFANIIWMTVTILRIFMLQTLIKIAYFSSIYQIIDTIASMIFFYNPVDSLKFNTDLVLTHIHDWCQLFQHIVLVDKSSLLEPWKDIFHHMAAYQVFSSNSRVKLCHLWKVHFYRFQPSTHLKMNIETIKSIFLLSTLTGCSKDVV